MYREKMIGLLPGSFNPIHNGHLKVAEYLLRKAMLDEIWFIISPQNPFKNSEDLLNENIRLKMVQLAIKGKEMFKAEDVEFSLPKPSFTINTLNALHLKYPKAQFSLIIGEDSLEKFHLWKSYKEILNHHVLLIYPRSGTNQTIAASNVANISEHPNCLYFQEAPALDVSSTFIREEKSKNHSIKEYVPHEVEAFIEEQHLYLLH